MQMEASPTPSSSALVQGGVRTAPKRVAVASGKGGSGKTTTTRNLAVAAAHAGLLVTTVDFDESPTLTKWWTRRPDALPGIEHVQAPMDKITDDLASDLREIGDCDLVIIDTPPSLLAYPKHTKALLDVVDLVLVPTQQYDEDLDAVIAWMHRLKVSNNKAFFLLTDTQRRESSLEDAKRRLVSVGKLAPIDVPHYADIPKTFSRGLGVVDVKGARGAADYVAVFHFLRDQLGI